MHFLDIKCIDILFRYNTHFRQTCLYIRSAIEFVYCVYSTQFSFLIFVRSIDYKGFHKAMRMYASQGTYNHALIIVSHCIDEALSKNTYLEF